MGGGGGKKAYAKPGSKILSLANLWAQCFPSVFKEWKIINYYSTFCSGRQTSLSPPPCPNPPPPMAVHTERVTQTQARFAKLPPFRLIYSWMALCVQRTAGTRCPSLGQHTEAFLQLTAPPSTTALATVRSYSPIKIAKWSNICCKQAADTVRNRQTAVGKVIGEYDYNQAVIHFHKIP